MGAKRKKKMSLSSNLTLNDEHQNEVINNEEEFSSEDEYFLKKYPRDMNYQEYLKDFYISTQDKKDAGSSKEDLVNLNSQTSQSPNKKCPKCNQKFNKTTYSILCFSCETWFCLKCSGLTKEKILSFKKEKKEWICLCCNDKFNSLDIRHLKLENLYLKKQLLIMEEKLTLILNKLDTLKGENSSTLQEKKNDRIQNNIPTYSEITKGATLKQKPNNLPVVIIKPRKNQDSKQTMNEIKNKINPVSIGVAVCGIKEIKNGGIVLKARSEEEIEKICKLSAEKLNENY